MRRRETSTEGGQLVVAHPVDVDAADRTAESQRRDHRTDGPVDRVGAGVLHAPGPILLPVERPQASLEYAGLADLLAVRCRVQLRLPRQKSRNQTHDRHNGNLEWHSMEQSRFLPTQPIPQNSCVPIVTLRAS